MGKMNKSKKKKKRVKPRSHDHRQTEAPTSFSKSWWLLCLVSWSRHSEMSELGRRNIGVVGVGSRREVSSHWCGLTERGVESLAMISELKHRERRVEAS